MNTFNIFSKQFDWIRSKYHKLSLLLLFSCVIGCPSFCQHDIEGMILAEETREPVPYAFLYIDGSTKSVTTDSLGFFRFTIPYLPCNIEITHLNYYPRTISLTYLPNDTIILMKQKEHLLNEIVILDERTKKDYLNKFKKEFLGEDIWGKSAKLVNESSLIFNSNDSVFSVSTTEPLLVKLSKLGYDVRVELNQFRISNNSNSTRIEAKYFFESIRDPDTKIHENRKRAYFNSGQHFFRSLYSNSLMKNGFKVFLGVRDSSTFQMTYLPASLGDSLVQFSRDVKLISQAGREYYIFYYSNKNGIPLDLEQNKEKPTFELSSIYFSENMIPIFKNGTTPSIGIYSGAIGKKRVGAALPSDYYPNDAY